ncbi:MAG: hypothetical protein QOC67_4839 [Pseudonocardiales bacterium]|nr:hypothetical protein [Pseudonocardiales bacterium]
MSVALLGACAGSGVDASAYDATLWPQRPVVDLSYEMAPDLRTATGRESVVFTPDARVCELVFRAWTNNPTTAANGASLRVTGAAVDGREVPGQVLPAGAPDGAPGTLISIPLAQCVNAGQSVRADLGFQVALGKDSDERVGYSSTGPTSWIGSGFPLLAWIRGSGWARDPAVAMNGETAASEEFNLRSLSVTAPSDFQVLGTGTAAGQAAGSSPGTTTHRFTAASVRDVSIAVGRYAMLERDINGVRLHVGTPAEGSHVDAQTWAAEISRAVTALSEHFGPFPYPDLWVTVTPEPGDGTEFPTAIQFSDAKKSDLRALVSHEVSHQWFYSLVGNNQAEHPWLDETLATVGEALVGGDASSYAYDDTPERVVGLMGQPMSYWPSRGGNDRYTEAAYNQGAAALLKARSEIGADRFDSELRSYIKANAHRVATPDDFARAFSGDQAVLGLLRTAGAFAN